MDTTNLPHTELYISLNRHVDVYQSFTYYILDILIYIQHIKQTCKYVDKLSYITPTHHPYTGCTTLANIALILKQRDGG